MSSRTELHEDLVKILGSRNVYFQPPSSLTMQYPCIRYKREAIDSDFANDTRYLTRTKYQVIVIDKDPDSEIVEKMIDYPMTSHIRHYVADNLNHDVFIIYY